MEFKDLLRWVGAAAFVLIFLVFAIIWVGFYQGEQANFQQGNVGLCGNVPEPYNTIFRQAGDKWKVQSAFIAAIFIAGEHDGGSDQTHFAVPSNWPNSDGPWASSPKGAQGPFQFMPGTWESNKQDGNGDGAMDVQNLWDASFGAAHLSAMNGAGGNTTDLNKLRDAASRYNSGRPWSQGQGIKETAAYVPRVIEAFQHYYCTAVAATGKWIWPVDGPITAYFGDIDAVHAQPHDGLDIAAAEGAPIKAVDGGKVVVVNLNPTANLAGVYVTIDHGGGLRSIYGHMVEGSPKVVVGQDVSQGQIIGEVDSTGRSTGNHLHLGATLNGAKVDPMNYLPPK